MVLLFNWKRICRESEGKLTEIFYIVDMITYKRIPKNSKSPIFKYQQKNFHGQSFLANPESLLENWFVYSPREAAEYVAVASLRRYSEYVATKKVTLNLLECPIGIEKIKRNRLLKIKNNEIYFRFENSLNSKGKY